MTKALSLLGSTGSIGVQTLQVAENLGIEITCMAANKNVKLMEEQARKFNPKLVVMYDENAAKELKLALKDTEIEVDTGMDGLCRCAVFEGCDTVLNSLVGMVGLKPTISAVNAKKKIALANKETLVAGGELVMQKVKENNVDLLPVDSEHSAIFQCLQGGKRNLNRIILTASGGPFFGKTMDDLKLVTKEQALKHPNWSMGAKITIDSSTMMNKGLEIIEACWLFGVPQSKIDVLVHRESIIHSMIEYNDNSVIAQMGVPNMTIPIQYSLTYPERFESPAKRLNLAESAKLSFYEADEEVFCCMKLCRKAFDIGGLMPAVLNGANEQAVELFLAGKIQFYQIPEFVSAAMNNYKNEKITSLEDIINADTQAREFVRSIAT